MQLLIISPFSYNYKKLRYFSDRAYEIFKLVDSDGNPLEGRHEIGLLLYHGGTVCDDGFNETAAEAICKQINPSYGMLEWTSGNRFSIQDDLVINLDDVHCSSTDWESCEYSEEHNCGHSEDVHLFCAPPLSGTISCFQKRM